MQCPPFASYGSVDTLLRKLFRPAAATQGLEAGVVHAGFAARELNAKRFGWRQNLDPTCLTLKRAEERGAGAVSPDSSPTCSESLIYLGLHVHLAKGVMQRDQGQKHGSLLVLHQGKYFMAACLEENTALVLVYVDGINHGQPVLQ